MKPSAIVYVPLHEGRCARVEVSVIEEALPTPMETHRTREPGITEMDAIAAKLSAKDYRITPPFETR